jgi:hypothetical protein
MLRPAAGRRPPTWPGQSRDGAAAKMPPPPPLPPAQRTTAPPSPWRRRFHRTSACSVTVMSRDEGKTVFDEIGREHDPRLRSDVDRVVGDTRRDQEPVARLKVQGRSTLDRHVDLPGHDVPHLLARMAVPTRCNPRGDLGPNLHDVPSRNRRRGTLDLGPLDSRVQSIVGENDGGECKSSRHDSRFHSRTLCPMRPGDRVSAARILAPPRRTVAGPGSARAPEALMKTHDLGANAGTSSLGKPGNSPPKS